MKEFFDIVEESVEMRKRLTGFIAARFVTLNAQGP
jgi:hypothetical protein